MRKKKTCGIATIIARRVGLEFIGVSKMLNETNVCKLIKKASDVSGYLIPKEEPTQPTAVFFTIDGAVGIRVTEYDKKVIAKLVEFGFMKPDYTFEKTNSLIPKLLSALPGKEIKCTPFLFEYISKKKTTMLRFSESETEVMVYDDKLLACFSDVKCYTENGKSLLYIMEKENVVGIVSPYKYDADRLVALAQKCTKPGLVV